MTCGPTPSNILQTPLRIVEPTAVTLQSLTAIRSAEQIVIRWQTSTEVDTLGFHLLRSTTGELAEAVRLTPSLIPARGNPAQSAVYSWVDTAEGLGSSGRYWLQELEGNGATRLYGPVRPEAATAGLQHRMLVPLVAR